MGKSINEKSKLFDIKASTNYGSTLNSILKQDVINAGEENKFNFELQAPCSPAKEIKPFSLCLPASNYFQKKVDNLKSEQVEESTPSINAGIRK